MEFLIAGGLALIAAAVLVGYVWLTRHEWIADDPDPNATSRLDRLDGVGSK